MMKVPSLLLFRSFVHSYDITFICMMICNNDNSTGPNEGSETVGGSLHVGRLAAPNKGYG